MRVRVRTCAQVETSAGVWREIKITMPARVTVMQKARKGVNEAEDDVEGNSEDAGESEDERYRKGEGEGSQE